VAILKDSFHDVETTATELIGAVSACSLDAWRQRADFFYLCPKQKKEARKTKSDDTAIFYDSAVRFAFGSRFIRYDHCIRSICINFRAKMAS